MESFVIPDLKPELETCDYIYTKNKKGDVQSLGFNIKNLFLQNDIPILEKHNGLITPAGLHIFIPPNKDTIEEDEKITDEDNVIPIDIYEKLLNLHKKNMYNNKNITGEKQSKKNNSTKKNKRKKKHSRGTRKKLN